MKQELVMYNLCVSVNEAEYALLEVMQQLDNKDDEPFVEEDSILAALSQNQYPTTPTKVQILNHLKVNRSQTEAKPSLTDADDSFNSDDDLMNDFSMCFDGSPFELEENSE